MKQDGVIHANQKTREETENEVQQKKKNNRIKKGEGSGEWSHPEELTAYSVVDMRSIRCARKRTFNHK